MKRYTNIIAFVLYACISFLIHGKYLTEFPSHIHGWAQSDRYALALGFTENGMDFFHPTTYYLNPTSDAPERIRETGITAVDFPIHEYLVAIGMKITGNHSPLIFRIYILLYSIVGLFFLFLLIKSITGNLWLAFLSTLILLASPIYTYYASGFLPSLPSLVNAIIGYYFYTNYLKHEKQKQFLLAIAFFTIAALARKPFIIFLLSVLLQQIGVGFRNKKINTKNTLILLISFGIFLSFYVYNDFLTNKYGSIFLGDITPILSLKEIWNTFVYILHQWGNSYFSIFQYIFILSLLAIYSGQKIFGNHGSFTIAKKFLFQTTIAFLGGLCYMIIMLSQFIAHDYYFLDSLFLPIILLSIFLLGAINWKNNSLFQFVFSMSFLLVFLCIMHIAQTQKDRRETGSWDEVEASIGDYTNADRFLDELHIEKQAKILVLGANTSNIPFILMQRKGFSLIHSSRENIVKSLEWPYNYIVMQDKHIMNDIVRECPEIVQKIYKIGGNGQISVFKKETTPSEKSVLEFLQLNQQKPIFTSTYQYDSIVNPIWSAVPFISDSTNTCGIISPDDLFGPAVSLAKDAFSRTPHTLLVASNFTSTSAPKELQIIVTGDCDETNQFYLSQSIIVSQTEKGQWKNHQYLFSLSELDCEESLLKVYIYNPAHESLKYDNFSISFY